jgi:histidinol-phosphatase (PHP family)
LPESNKIEPLGIHGLADYHCHCDYSSDARGTVDEYCEAALQRGLVEICFTTHYDANPNSEGKEEYILVAGKKAPVIPDSLEPYVNDVRKAHEKYYPMGLMVKAGVEFGWYPGCESEVGTIQNRFEFDYLLCGIHELENLCFCCRDTFKRCFDRYSVETMVDRYVTEVKAAANSGLFNTIAHLDYVRKYGLEYYGDSLDAVLRERLPETFPSLTVTGIALEVNTAGLRKGLDSYFPRMDILNAARRAGVEITYLGSDAHRPEQVGFDFDAAAALVPQAIGSCEGF